MDEVKIVELIRRVLREELKPIERRLDDVELDVSLVKKILAQM